MEVDKQIEQDRVGRISEELPAIDSALLRGKVRVLNNRLLGMNKTEKKQVKQLQEDYLRKYESRLKRQRVECVIHIVKLMRMRPLCR